MIKLLTLLIFQSDYKNFNLFFTTQILNQVTILLQKIPVNISNYNDHDRNSNNGLFISSKRKSNENKRTETLQI